MVDWPKTGTYILLGAVVWLLSSVCIIEICLHRDKELEKKENQDLHESLAGPSKRKRKKTRKLLENQITHNVVIHKNTLTT